MTSCTCIFRPMAERDGFGEVHMDTVDWINQITSWLLLIDLGIFLGWMYREAGKR